MLKKEKNSLTEELMEVKALKQSLWLEKAALTTDNARLVRLLAISSQKCNSLDSDNHLLRSEREAVDKSFHTLGDQHSKVMDIGIVLCQYRFKQHAVSVMYVAPMLQCVCIY